MFRSLASVVAFALTLSATPALAAADPVIIEAGSVAPDGTPWADWLGSIKKRMEKDSKGRLKMKVFLASRRGGEKEMVEDTKRGRLQLFGGSTGSIASKYVPELDVFELPFIFSSDAEADYVMNALRGHVKKLLAKRGFIFVMWSENGWHGYGTKEHCIKTPADMKGLKMRSQESEIHIATYKAFGASPVSMGVPEVLHSLQTGVVDGFSNTPLFSQAVSWHTGIKYYTYTKHIYQPALLVLSKKWYDTLAPDLQKILTSTEGEKEGFATIRSLTPLLLQNFEPAGVKLCPFTEADQAPFKAAVKPVWDAFAKKSAGNKKILEEVMKAKKAFKGG